MPELPEVETVCRGIAPHVDGQEIQKLIVRNSRLRWPVKRSIAKQLAGLTIENVTRRGKYLLLNTSCGSIVIHLGMSGKISIVPMDTPIRKHDHIDLIFTTKICLRFNDPRRFGAFLWIEADPLQHPLLSNLGPEPLSASFSGKYLFEQAKTCKRAIKSFIMDGKIVVGVGNIYATESLFAAGIHPNRSCNRVTLAECNELVKEIKRILRKAIKVGGTTLKDFLSSEGKPGYFSQKLKVYGRAGEPCLQCKSALVSMQVGQRTTVLCEQCQR